MIDKAIEYLKEHGIESFERMGILVIPVRSVENLDQTAKDMKRMLDSIGFDKSWSLDPYYYERRQTLTSAMYDDKPSANIT